MSDIKKLGRRHGGRWACTLNVSEEAFDEFHKAFDKLNLKLPDAHQYKGIELALFFRESMPASLHDNIMNMCAVMGDDKRSRLSPRACSSSPRANHTEKGVVYATAASYTCDLAPHAFSAIRPLNPSYKTGLRRKHSTPARTPPRCAAHTRADSRGGHH